MVAVDEVVVVVGSVTVVDGVVEEVADEEALAIEGVEEVAEEEVEEVALAIEEVAVEVVEEDAMVVGEEREVAEMCEQEERLSLKGRRYPSIDRPIPILSRLASFVPRSLDLSVITPRGCLSISDQPSKSLHCNICPSALPSWIT